MNGKPNQQKLAYSYKDLEDLAGLGEYSLNEAVKSGKLRKIKVGRRVVFPAADVHKLLGVETV